MIYENVHLNNYRVPTLNSTLLTLKLLQQDNFNENTKTTQQSIDQYLPTKRPYGCQQKALATMQYHNNQPEEPEQQRPPRNQQRRRQRRRRYPRRTRNLSPRVESDDNTPVGYLPNRVGSMFESDEESVVYPREEYAWITCGQEGYWVSEVNYLTIRQLEEYQVEEKELKRMMEPIELWKKERSRRWKEKLSPEGKRRERKAEKRRRYWRNKKRRQMGLPQEPEEPRWF